VLIGELRLDTRPKAEMLGEATVAVESDGQQKRETFVRTARFLAGSRSSTIAAR